MQILCVRCHHIIQLLLDHRLVMLDLTMQPWPPFNQVFHRLLLLRAEVLWVLHTINRHHSYKSNNGIHALFKAMFRDSQHVITLLRRLFKDSQSQKVNNESFFETFSKMNKTTKNKQLDLHIRHWTTEETGTYVYSCYCGSWAAPQLRIYWIHSC